MAGFNILSLLFAGALFTFVAWLFTGGTAAIALGRLVGYGSTIWWVALAIILIWFVRR